MVMYIMRDINVNLLCLISFSFGACIEISLNNSASMFVPTNEWQVVQPHQQIPPGLHIRHSLKTGETEAKLMDWNSTSPSDHAAVLVPDGSSSTSSKAHSAHRSVKPRGLPYLRTKEPSSMKTAKKLRTYDQLKNMLAFEDTSAKTGLEQIVETMDRLRSVNNTDALLVLLELSDALHQIDNGRHFAEHGGFPTLLKFLQSDNLELKKAALTAVSAAVQANAVAKKHAFEDGILTFLYELIKSLPLGLINVDHSKEVASSALSALGSLLRDFPAAQHHFFSPQIGDDRNLTGSTALLQLYDSPVAAAKHPKQIGNRIKIITLLGDIASERENARKDALTSPGKDVSNIWQLYSKTPFDDLLNNDGWCTRVQRLLYYDLEPPVADHQLNRPFNHNQREMILSSVVQLFPACRDSLRADATLFSALQGLEHEYKFRSETRDDQDNDYFSTMHQLVANVRKLLTETALFEL